MDGQDFRGFYRSLPDSELLSISEDWQFLVDDAKSALLAELERRGIEFHEPPPRLKDSDDSSLPYLDLVTIRRYRDLSEAIVARGVVESAGIYCFLKDENLVRLDWQISNLIGGISLQVSRSDAEAAERILEEPTPETISLPDQSLFEQPHCPHCDSIDIIWERRGRKAALLSLYLFSLPAPRGSESWHCNDCGLRWTEEDDPAQAVTQMEE
ncbi:DUF2007 domain-containing protein [Edaphobacter sp. 12200R-103]|jgi:hypothetical protein|uniref:putative signal transducing protein n=1 Tax=Edaphobacter sp. 12200R-103 TaxID=2703788 RepID=UPI00138B7B0F|nr:DUF2007 domain-containing protein [Edaphobacter sp. 12200R-103]QHS53348.1 DUF2007 domain-containing protein [Edaphobacter sp. 12200R-103]